MQTIELPFTTLNIYDGYVIGKTKEGVNLSVDDHRQVLDLISQHLQAPFAFIIDEINRYSIDLSVMLHIRKDKNISCLGVVYYRDSTKIALKLGSGLINKPLYFSTDIGSTK